MNELSPIGLQLYSLREAIAEDLEGTLNRVAEMGYLGVEPYGGLDHEKAAPLIQSLGMQVASMHAALPIGDDKNKVVEMAAAYGVSYIVAPYMPPENFTSEDGIKRTAELLNEANRAAFEGGRKFAYHNHDFEFGQADGRPAYDILKEHLDAAVFLQVDTYWVKVAGYDPVQVVTDLGRRAPLLHIKDGSTKKEDAMLAVGEGVMDVPGIVNAGNGHTEWLIVELDRCDTDMFEAVEKSYHYMLKEGLARGRNS